MTLAILDLLNIITLVVASTIIILFLSRVHQSIAYVFLAAFVYCYVSGATVPILRRASIYTNFPFWIYAPTNWSIFSLPFLHLFLKTLSGEFQVKRLGWTFVLPILSILSQFYFWSLPSEEKLIQLTNDQWSNVFYTYRTIDFAYTLFMIGITIRTVNRYQRNIDQFYSQGLPKGFSWVKTLCYFLVVLMIPLMIPKSVYADLVYTYVGLVFISLGILMLLWVGIAGMNQKFMVIRTPYLSDEKNEPSTNEDSAQDEGDSSFSKESELLEQLVAEIRTKQLYRSVNLNLDELSRALKISPRRLSNLINQESGKNFRNFINGFRIEYAKQQLESGVLENMSMNGLAQESGFKSRTTFYSAFKSETGSSPLVFLEIKKKNKK